MQWVRQTFALASARTSVGLGRNRKTAKISIEGGTCVSMGIDVQWHTGGEMRLVAVSCVVEFTPWGRGLEKV